MKTKLVDSAVAAQSFLNRRTISRSHGSSVRKLIRADRIRQGQRPREKSNRFTVADLLGPTFVANHPFATLRLAHLAGLKSPTEGTFARLHPTKGFRFGNAI